MFRMIPGIGTLLLVIFLVIFLAHILRSFYSKQNYTEHFSVSDVDDDCNVLLSNNFYHSSGQDVPKCKYVTPLNTNEITDGVNGILFADTTNQKTKRHSGWGLGKTLDWIIQSVLPSGKVIIQPNSGNVQIGKNVLPNNNNSKYKTTIDNGLFVKGNRTDALKVSGHANLQDTVIDGRLQTDYLKVNKDLDVHGSIFNWGTLFSTGKILANGVDLTNQRLVKGDLDLYGGKLIFRDLNGNKPMYIEKRRSKKDKNSMNIYLGKNGELQVQGNRGTVHSFDSNGLASHKNSICIGDQCLNANEIKKLKDKINLPCKRKSRRRRRRRRRW